MNAMIMPIRSNLYEIEESTKEEIIIRLVWDRGGLTYRTNISTNDHAIKEMSAEKRQALLSGMAKMFGGELITADLIIPHAVALF